MKKLVALPLAVLFAAACSEPTVPASNLAVSYGQSAPVPPPPPPVCSSGTSCATFDEFGITAASEYGIASASETSPAPVSQGMSTRRANSSLVISPTVGPVNGAYDIHFNLYIIGAWYGEGSRRQVDQVIQMTWQCDADGTSGQAMYASFANLLSGVTSYPLDVSDKGHFGGQYYNNGVNVLGYLGYTGGDGTDYYQNKGDVADSRYNVERVITSNCPAGQFHVTLTGIGLTTVSHASWAIDNLSIN